MHAFLPRRAALGRLFGTTALLGGASLGLSGPALAQFRVEIAGVGATQIPIAIGRFRDEARSPQPLSAIIKADLERSGLFRSLDATASALDDTSRPRSPNGAARVRMRCWPAR